MTQRSVKDREIAPVPRIPVMRPRLASNEAALPYLERMQRSGVYSNSGPLVRELENRYATLVGVSSAQVVATSNATAALAGAIAQSRAIIWSCPAWTFAATALAVRAGGKEVLFRDVQPDNWRMSLDSVPADQGALVVVPFGSPELGPLSRVEGELIIDAAASLGSFPNLSDLGDHSSVVFSLHATKVLGCGEGGLAVFGDVSRAEQLRRWLNFGFGPDRESLCLGTNAKLSEVSAAYALAALDSWEVEKAEWEEAQRACIAVSRAVDISRGPHPDSLHHPYWLAVFGGEGARATAERTFSDAGIGFRRWWPSVVPSMPAFAYLEQGPFPVASSLAETVLGLPMYRGLEKQAVEEIHEALLMCRA